MIPSFIDILNGDLFLRILNSNITIDLNKSICYREKRLKEEIDELTSIVKN